jgi:hypothetical protein
VTHASYLRVALAVVTAGYLITRPHLGTVWTISQNTPPSPAPLSMPSYLHAAASHTTKFVPISTSPIPLSSVEPMTLDLEAEAAKAREVAAEAAEVERIAREDLNARLAWKRINALKDARFPSHSACTQSVPKVYSDTPFGLCLPHTTLLWGW